MFRIRDRVPYVLSVAALAVAAGACNTDVTAPVFKDPGGPVRVEATTATSTLLVDTGPGANSIGTILDNFSASDYQFIAGKITLANDAKIESVSGWMWVALGGSIDVHIRADNAGLPGSDLHSQNYSPAAGTPFVFGWTEFSSFNVTLAAGTYWVTLEPVRGGGFAASMPHGATTPLADYRFLGNVSLGAWSDAFGAPGSNFGFRVTGSLVTPATMIADLGTYVDGSGIPKGNATSIDSKLQLALNAIAADQTAAACTYLQDIISYTKAQSGKKIAVSVANQIIADTNAIRAKLGC